MHKNWVIIYYVHVSLCTVGLVACVDQISPKLRELMQLAEPVKTYESFQEINPVTPLPGKFKLGLGAIAKMVLSGQQQLPFVIVPPHEYNTQEKEAMKFFEHTGVQKSLRLLSYARQLKAAQPYRINPFVTFFTIRPENALLANNKVGPAAVVVPILQPKGPYQGSFSWRDSKGESFKFDVSISPESLPLSGSMFLFDHNFFTMSDLFDKPENNILQDIIIHEFTHIWNSEIISPKALLDSTIVSKRSEGGHDTMIVSNPHLAFTEGLAEAFEALYGTTASQFANMTKAERKQFYGGLNTKLQENLEFLVNRQVYIRENTYLYNLYDFGNCTLRAVDTVDSREHGMSGKSAAPTAAELLERIKRGENIDWDQLNVRTKEIDFEHFKKRFYAAEKRVSTLTLRHHCQLDSPGRLESKEGYIASLFYGLITSGAFTGDALETGGAKRSTASISDKTQRLESFKRSVSHVFVPRDTTRAYLDSSVLRTVANLNPSDAQRMRNMTRNFLIGFRNLALGIQKSDAISMDQLLKWYFSSQSMFNRDEQLRLTFYFMIWSQGQFFDAQTSEEKMFQGWFKEHKTIKHNLDAIFQLLDKMYQSKEIERVMAKLGKTPEIYVQFQSKFRDGVVIRMNVNLAHHVDLIEMFGKNSKAIAELAAKLDRGEYFASEAEFLDFARSIDAEPSVRQMLDHARQAIAENAKIRSQFGISGYEQTSALH